MSPPLGHTFVSPLQRMYLVPSPGEYFLYLFCLPPLEGGDVIHTNYFIPSPQGVFHIPFYALPSRCVSRTILFPPLGLCFAYIFVSFPRGVLHVPFYPLPLGYVSSTFLSPFLEVCFTYLFVPSPWGVLHVPFCPLPSGCASRTFLSPPLGLLHVPFCPLLSGCASD